MCIIPEEKERIDVSVCWASNEEISSMFWVRDQAKKSVTTQKVISLEGSRTSDQGSFLNFSVTFFGVIVFICDNN